MSPMDWKGGGPGGIRDFREVLRGERIMPLLVSEGGMNLKATDINRLIETLGVKSLSGGQTAVVK